MRQYLAPRVFLFVAIMLMIAKGIPGSEESENKMHLQTTTPELTEERVANLLDQMTLEEKTLLLSGATTMDLHAISRLDIPSLGMADGPLGCRWGKATAFPAPIAVASTWDTELVERFGVAIGKEFRHKGRQVWLGPCINIVRVPFGGRNFESYGEDPCLTSKTATAAIRGAQSQKVAACVKHYACNNQDFQRHTINIEVDERTMREIYLPGFRAAVLEGGALSVMSSYNRLNGPYLTDSKYMQQDILKDEWGFEGFVVSDWGAQHSTVLAANAGLDLEMDLTTNVGEHWGDGQLLKAVHDGEVDEALIDDKVRRILRVLIWSDRMDQEIPQHDTELLEHRDIALEIAREGIVLLKNEKNALPIQTGSVQKIAVLGPNASSARLGGGGSSELDAYHKISPIDGLRARYGDTAVIVEEIGAPFPDELPVFETANDWFSTSDGEKGWAAEFFDNSELEGEPILSRVDATLNFDWGNGSPAPEIAAENFSARWASTFSPTTDIELGVRVRSDDGYRLFLNDALVRSQWGEGVHAGAVKPQLFKAGEKYEFRFEFFEKSGGAVASVELTHQGLGFDHAIALAKESDVALVFAGTFKREEGEGGDRETMLLSGRQNELIKEVAAVNPRTVVVLVGGSQFDMTPWIDDVQGVIQAWYPGQEGGEALADIISGIVNPSGKLPMTFCRKWEDHPAAVNYPGNQYTEGLYIGYRHYDKLDIEPLFPFGFGLSYTDFEFSNLEIDASQLSSDGAVKVSLDVKNTGRLAGAEVAQLYVGDPESTEDRPVKELKAYTKVTLNPGETERVTLEINSDDLMYFDVKGRRWIAEAGEFDILVGSSSRDIHLAGSFELGRDIVRETSVTGSEFHPIPEWIEEATEAQAIGGIAMGKPATASSEENAYASAKAVVDGSMTTRWSSKFYDPQWVAIDLEQEEKVTRMILNWENAHAASYTIQSSLDGENWRDLFKNEECKGGLEEIAFPPAKARWIRVMGHKRATEWGYSLYEIQVFND